MNTRTRRRLVLSLAVSGVAVGVVAGGLALRSFIRSGQLAERRSEGLALFASGDHAGALGPLAFAARRNDDTEVVLALAESRLAVPEANGRHFTTAAAYFRSVLAREQDNLRAMHGLLDAYVGLGHVAEMRPLLARILIKDPADLRAHEIELELLNLTGRFSEAAAKSRVLQELEPTRNRWRAAELLCLERSGADAEGRLARVREWLADSRLAGDPALRLLESDLLRESGRGEASRTILQELAARGVGDRPQLEALVAAIESSAFTPSERDALVDRAIASSRAVLSDESDASALEGERLLRAGRLEELASRFGGADTANPAVFRLLHAGLYLAGDRAAADALAQATSASDGYAVVARALAEGGSVADRIAVIAGPRRACPADPVLAILLSDVLLEAGEYDEAQSILIRAFEEGGQCHQPLGTRAVRTSITLGRVRDAFRVAEDLLVRYGPAGDPTVAMLAVEAWAAAIKANYQPPTRGGIYGSNSTEALRRFWTMLSGPEATSGPTSLAPAVADACIARGDHEAARAILVGAFADPDAALELPALRLGQVMQAAAIVDPALGASLIGVGPDGGVSGEGRSAATAAVVAQRLLEQGDAVHAIRTIERALTTATGADRRMLERMLYPIVHPERVGEWLGSELSANPDLETAAFVLSRSESWQGGDGALVAQAISVMRRALGEESIRTVVAEAAMHLAFHAGDRARIAASIAKLDAAALRSPDSASVLTTLAALFEHQDPPQYDRSSRLLARAVAAEPGTPGIYPQLVHALQQVGDFEGAELALEAYIGVAGEDLQSRRSVADFKARQGELAEAARIREQLVGRSKEVVDAIALARIRQRLGDVAGAESILVDMRIALAASATADAAGIDASRLLIERELSLVYARDGRLDDARKALDAASSNGLAGPRLDEVRANLELAYGDIGRARAIADALASLPAGTAREGGSRQLLLARIHLREGRETEARDALARALESDPENAEAATVAAALLAGQSEGRGLLQQSLRAVAQRRPDLAAAIELLDAATDSNGRVRPDEAVLLRAQALTGTHAASPLAWRVAAQLHTAAGRSDDASRIAQRALSRLPNDASIGRLATETAIAAGRVDEAASSASAWRKMASAESLDVDVARATIELIQRRPERGFALLEPFADEILARAGDGGPSRILVACAVQSGRWSVLLRALSSASGVRRGEIVAAWIESTQTLEPAAALEALAAIAPIAASDDVGRAACISAWTGLCDSGLTDACALAERSLDGWVTARIPVDLLRADLLAAQGDLLAAADAYRAIYARPLAALGLDGSRLDPASATDARVIAALRADPVAIVALANAARSAVDGSGESPDPVAAASIALAALPASTDIADTLARALAAVGRFDDAVAHAQRIDDPVLSAIVLAEVEAARGAVSEARRAMARAEARLQAGFPPTRMLSKRVQALAERIGRTQLEAAAGAERNGS